MKLSTTLAFVIVCATAFGQPAGVTIPPDPTGDIDNAAFGIFPNLGQITDSAGNTVPSVKMYTQGAMPRGYFRQNGSFSLVLATDGDTINNTPDTLRRLDITMTGTNALYPTPTVYQERDRYMNFYLPQCGPNGITNVHAWKRVIYSNIYPDISMQIYSGQAGQKLAYVIEPYANPQDIELTFAGQQQLGLDLFGNLKILLAGQWVVLSQAVAYQVGVGNTIDWVSWTPTYQVNNGQGTVHLKFNTYDHSRPLVLLIGPLALGGGSSYDEYGICWSTYIGGELKDYEKDVQGDADGNAYVVGRTESGYLHFPNLPGSNLTSGSSNKMGTLMKFNGANELKWSALIGGSGPLPGDDLTSLEAIAVKTSPTTAIYAVGLTNDDFYTMQQGTAYYQTPSGGFTKKGCIAKFDDQGFLQWSTLFGTVNAEIQAITLVGADKIAISGIIPETLPAPATQLAGATVQAYHGGNTDAFIAMFDSGDHLVWSSYYGGSGDESRAIVNSLYNETVLAGTTTSSNIPLIGAAPAYLQAFNGNADVFVSHFGTGMVLDWASYLGGSGADYLGPKGARIFGKDIVLVGQCASLPTLVNGTGWYDDVAAVAPARNGFIARFAQITYAPKWITYLGSGTQHFPWCLSNDAGGTLTVGGYTNDPAFVPQPLSGFYQQPGYNLDHYDNLNTGTPFDGFLVRFNDLQQRTWATLFGGSAGMVYPEHENIMGTGYIGDRFYAVGYTSKPIGIPAAYFPLDDNQGNPYTWFNPLFNYNGFTSSYTDGFIARFCNENTIGIQNVEKPNAAFTVVPETENALHLTGLNDGTHTVELYDAQGKRILSAKLQSQAGLTGTLVHGSLQSAMYVVHVDGRLVSRFIPIR